MSVLEREIWDDSSKPFNLQACLNDGVLLCHLMLKLKEDSIPKVHEHPTNFLMKKQNVVYFLNAVESLGLARHRQFQVADLYDATKFYRVVESLESIAYLMQDTLKEESDPSTNPTLNAEQPEMVMNASNEPGNVQNRPQKMAPKGNVVKNAPRKLPMPNVATKQHHIVANIRRSFAMVKGSYALVVFQGLSPADKQKIEKAIVRLQAHARRRIARRVFEKRLTNNEYRRNIVVEMLTTEEVYLNQLNCLCKVCTFFDI